MPLWSTISTGVVRVQRTHLDELLAPRIAGIQLDRGKPLEFRTQVCARRLANARRTGYEDGAKDVHAALARLLEARFQARRPETRGERTVDMKGHDGPVVQPLL